MLERNAARVFTLHLSTLGTVNDIWETHNVDNGDKVSFLYTELAMHENPSSSPS